MKSKTLDVSDRVRWRKTISASQPNLTRLTRTFSLRDISEPAGDTDLGAGWEGEEYTTPTFMRIEH